MNPNTELAFWLAFAHKLNSWRIARRNHLALEIISRDGRTLENFFELSQSIWKQEYALAESEIRELLLIYDQLASLRLLSESLQSRKVKIITILDHEYPKNLRRELRLKHSPVLFYGFGNLSLLNARTWAVIGSREPNKKAIEFARMVGKIASLDRRVIICGLANGIDIVTLEAVLHNNGAAIAVLPHGILMQSYRWKRFKTAIDRGHLLLLSSFHPFEAFSSQNAIVRNRYICAMGDEVIVPESGITGGTWDGASKAIKSKQAVFVRKPDKMETNGNYALINAGGIPIEIERLSNRLKQLDTISSSRPIEQ